MGRAVIVFGVFGKRISCAVSGEGHAITKKVS